MFSSVVSLPPSAACPKPPLLLNSSSVAARYRPWPTPFNSFSPALNPPLRSVQPPLNSLTLNLLPSPPPNSPPGSSSSALKLPLSVSSSLNALLLLRSQEPVRLGGSVVHSCNNMSISMEVEAPSFTLRDGGFVALQPFPVVSDFRVFGTLLSIRGRSKFYFGP